MNIYTGSAIGNVGSLVNIYIRADDAFFGIDGRPGIIQGTKLNILTARGYKGNTAVGSDITIASNQSIGEEYAKQWTPTAAVFEPLVTDAKSFKIVFTAAVTYTVKEVTHYEQGVPVQGLVSHTSSASYTYTCSFTSASAATLGSSAFTLSPVHESAVSSWAGNRYVQGYSKIKVTYNSSGVTWHSAGLAGYTVKIGGTTSAKQTAASYTWPTVISASCSVIITLTDSRGFTASKTIAVTMIPYQRPSITGLTAKRCNASGTESDSGTCVKLGMKLTYASVDGQNTISATRKHKTQGGSYSGTTALTLPSAAASGTNKVVTISGLIVTSPSYETANSYIFCIRLMDRAGNYTEATVTVPTESWGMHILRNTAGAIGVAFGKVAEAVNQFQIPDSWSFVGGGGIFSGNLIRKISEVDLKSATNGIGSSTWGGCLIRDRNDYPVSYFSTDVRPDGRAGTGMYVYNRDSSGEQIGSAVFELFMNKSGAVTYNVSNPAALRAGIEIPFLAGSNYTKLPDGTLICWGTVTNTSDGYAQGTFPVAFTSVPTIIVSPAYSAGGGGLNSRPVGAATKVQYTVYFRQISSTAATTDTNQHANFVAIGRWM